MKEFQYILEKVFSDNKISRAEKDAIEQVIKAKGFNENSLAVLRSQLFDYAREIATTKTITETFNCTEAINKLLIPKTQKVNITESAFSPGDDCRNSIIREIHKSKNYIDICVFTISDNVIVKELLAAWKKGLKIRIITDNDKQYDRGSDILRIKDAGVPIRTDYNDSHMHHKFAIFDRQVTLLGSYNWTRSAALNNNEDLIVTDNPEVTSKFLEEFDTLWANFSEYNA
jgi:mitochondrial cardiolipin hydrolase